MMDVTRSGIVALVGVPNVGKSTLLNKLVGEKVGIISPKANTTRLVVRGVVTQGSAQIVFVDTPGLNTSTKAFDRMLVQQAQGALADADLVMLVIEARKGLDGRTREIMDLCRKMAKPTVLVLNKVDMVQPRSKLLPLMQQVADTGAFIEVFAIDAVRGKGVDDIVPRLAKRLPEGPWFFPPDTVTDVPVAMRLAELTREKAMLFLQQELPYGLTVLPKEMGEDEKGLMVVQQDILVSAERHKGMVVGQKGAMLQRIGSAARADIQEVLGRPVYLDLSVRVEARWQEKLNLLQELGLGR